MNLLHHKSTFPKSIMQTRKIDSDTAGFIDDYFVESYPVIGESTFGW